MNPVRRLRTATALAAAAVALCVPAAPAGAQAAPVTGLSITPGVMELELPTREVDFPFTIANNEAEPMRVGLTVQQLTQSLDGSMGYGAPAPLTVTPADVLLPPGRSATVRVTGSLPAGAPAMYAGLLAEPRGRAPSGNVEIRTRVAALMLLTTPGAHRRTVEVTDVALTPTAEERTYRVSAVLRNTGEVHVRPRGVVRISQPGGPALGTATLTGMVLLPGAARRLDGGLWTAPPPPLDRVRMDVIVSDPPATGGREVTLPATGTEEAGVAPVVPETRLGELGGGGQPGGGLGWPVLLAVVLLLLVSALLLWTHRRAAHGGLPAEAVSS